MGCDGRRRRRRDRRGPCRHGDTFVVQSGPDQYLFTFSPVGVESFYALPEEIASKGLADYLMLRRKLPDEIFDGRRTLPGSLFRRDDVASYLVNLDQALEQTVAELGSEGTVDLFDLTRRLGHRMGLASWAGPGSANGDVFDRLVGAFDTLDGSDAFVHPDAMAAVAASDKRAERAALDAVVELLAAARATLGFRSGDRRGAVRPDRRGLVIGATRRPHARNRAGRRADPHRIDVESHGGARLGIRRPDRSPCTSAPRGRRRPGSGAALRAGEHADGTTLDHVARRVVSGRLRHRRRALSRARRLDDRHAAAAAEHIGGAGAGSWDPDRWHRYRLADPSALRSPMLVTAFGHGKHSCPAQPFSLSAMTTAMTHLLGRYQLTPRWDDHPRPVPAQIGGVARAADPCPVDYVAW